MPWCDTCHRLVEHRGLDAAVCPDCGMVLDDMEEERRPIPWYFKLMILTTVVYLGYRAYQGIGWLVHHV